MSTWTFKAGLLGVCLVLGGCVADLGGGFGGGGSGGAETSRAVTTDGLVITGPRGYCIDPETTRDPGDTAFVVLGNCAVISESRRARQPEDQAVLTASVSAPDASAGISTSIGELDAFFRSEDGRRLISRAGDPETVTIQQSFAEGDVFFLRVRDESDTVISGVGRDYWRAYFDRGPRIVTLSVLSLQGDAMPAEVGLSVLRDFVAAVRAANPQAGDALGAEETGGLVGLFGGRD